jgi:signal transduction histidine kinase/CheY-like chemotaxis protein/AraC-like DNA-binding protein/ligand-binding sensor domain-containing protein
VRELLRIGTILLLYVLPLFLQAQGDYSFQIKKLNAEDGLLGQRAKFISEDRNGFIWIATLDGLNRFDGYNFKWFNQSNSDLNYAYIQYELPIDEAGYSWLNYEKKVVECFHTSTFETLTFTERFPDAPFKEKNIRKIFSSKQDGSIFLQTWKAKSYWLKNGKWIYLPTMDKTIPTFFNKDIIWYSKDDAYYQIDKNGQVSKVFSNENKYSVNINISTKGIYKISQFNPQKKEFTVFDYQNKQRTEVSRTILPLQDRTINGIHYNAALDKFIFRTVDNTNQRKAFVFDATTEQVTPIPLENFESLLLIDKKGVLWFNTLTNIVLVKIQPTSFDIYPEVNASRGIWANDEFVLVNSERNYSTFFNQKTQQQIGLLKDELFSIFHDDKNKLWGSFTNTITQVDLKSGNVLQSIPRNHKLNGRNWAILKDKNGDWWAGSEGRHIERFQSDKSDSIQVFDQYNEFEYLKDALVIHFLEDGDYIWVSSDKGLILIHKKKGVVSHFHKKATQSFQLPFNDIHFLYQDKEGVFWAATNYEGLVRFELNDKKEVQNLKQYTINENLSSNVLYTIFEDKNNRLWISTLNGISCFNKKTEEVLTFSTQDELSNNEFNRISGFQAADGRIYFGAMQGAVGFYPDDVIQKMPYQANLLISQVQKYSSKNEQLFDYTQSVLETKTIIQQPWERYFTIEVSLADFYHANLLRYHYQIEGLHDDFRLMDGNRLQLSNLPYGKYELHIKGQAADKRFSEDEIHLTLQIIRPFYLHWWFILLAITTLIGIVLMVYNYRIAHLKQQKIILEQKVVERTKKINEDKIIIEKQAKELKVLDQLKDRFFTNISHELRTPLTLILSPLGTLLKSKNLSNKEFTYTRVIQRHAQYLLKRINEIMELNQLEAQKSAINLQPIRFYDFIKVAVSNFESIAPQKNITFIFDYQLSKDIQILLDKDKYEHIIYNYLSNAFKYTPQNGQVEVTLKEQNNAILFEVRDTGIGISKAALPYVFDRFYQADNAQKSSSSGIGLALCQEVSNLIGGRVWVESEIDKGSVFFFEMPYKEVLGLINEEDSMVDSSPTLPINLIDNPLSTPSSHSKILLVEDNPDLRDYIQSVLSEFYEVETATNGKEALDKLAENTTQPSLIISDIMMPVMDGLELLEIIKTSDKYRHIPMVMLTARSSMEAKLSALQLGVDDYITKPFHEEELLIRIQNILINQAERLSFLKENKASNTLEEPEATLFISENDQKWLSEVEKTVQENLSDSQFTKLIWAEKMLISERQLRRKVKELTGLTLTKYIQLARLKNARHLLETGQKSTVAEVSYAVGFETPKYFSKLFHQEYGQKPITYFR